MEDPTDVPFAEVLARLVQGGAKSRDPRARRVAAVTQALVESGNTNTNTTVATCSAAHVYAAGMTALQGSLLRQTPDLAAVTDALGTQVALLAVLTMVIPHTPAPIVGATLAMASRVLRAIVALGQSIDGSLDTADELGGVSAVLRGAAQASGQIALQLAAAVDTKLVQQFYKGTLLALLTDPRPKVRQAAQNAVLEVLAQPTCLPVLRRTTTAYFVRALQQARKQASHAPNKSSSLATLLPVTAFLERAIRHVRDEAVLVELMELLTLLLQAETAARAGATATTTTTDFVALSKQKKRTDGGEPLLVINALLAILKVVLEDDEAATLPADFCSRAVASLLTAQPLWVFRPGTVHASVLRQGRTLWGQVLLEGCRRVLEDETQGAMAAKLLPLVVQMVLLLAKPVDETDEEDAAVAFALFVDLTQLFRAHLPSLLSKGGGTKGPLTSVLTSLEQVLQPAFQPTWSVSLTALSICLQYVEDAAYATEMVEHLIRLHNDPALGLAAQKSIEECVSTLVQSAGLEKVWSWTFGHDDASQVTAGVARERGWVLALMRSSSQLAQPFPPTLAFFQDTVLALARRMDQHVVAGSSKHKLENRLGVIDTWKLLPSFLQQLPPDLSERTASLTTTIGKAIEDKRYPELVPVMCHSISLLVNSSEEHLELHGEMLQQASAKLLPLLFRVSMSIAQDSSEETGQMETDDAESKSGTNSEKGQQLQILGDAISSLGKVADQSFLQGLFKKLMLRLLEELQLDTPREGQICAYLSLAQPLVKSGALEENSIAFLFRAIKPCLRDGQHGPRALKRAYKVLAELCEKHSSFFSDPGRLEDLSSLLKETAGSSQVAARYMRLKCLSRVVDGLTAESVTPALLEKLLAVMSEILLCLKDSNGKTRDAAYELLLVVASKSGYETMLRILTAGLAAETPHMRSASVMALSRLVHEAAGEEEELQASLPLLLTTVLCLMEEDSREVIKSVVGFARVCVTAIPKEHLEPLLPELVGSLLNYNKVKDRFRNKVKIILKKLVKRFGYDGLMPYVPDSDSRLLTHMRKVDERQKRRKAAGFHPSDKSVKVDFENALDSDEDDSDDGRTLMTSATRGMKSQASRMSVAKSAQSRSRTTMTRRQREARNAVQLPSEADGKIVDMLGSNISKRVSFAQQIDDEDAASDGDDEIAFDDDGMLVVREHVPPVETPNEEEESRKRGRFSKYESVKAGKQSGAPNKRTKKTGDLGTAYKSKKAGGDVRRKEQKYEPYAYVPLNAKAFSKKHRKSAVESMASVVRKGKKHS